jgi:hypothetical protein
MYKQREVAEPVWYLMQTNGKGGDPANPMVDGKCCSDAGAIYKTVREGAEKQRGRPRGVMMMSVMMVAVFVDALAVDLRSRLGAHAREDLKSALEGVQREHGHHQRDPECCPVPERFYRFRQKMGGPRSQQNTNRNADDERQSAPQPEIEAVERYDRYSCEQLYRDDRDERFYP